MAKLPDLEKLSYAELQEVIRNAQQLLTEKQSAAKNELKESFIAQAREHGISLEELFGKGRKGGKGSVAIKYRDPKNPENTWTGRGRMPRWLQAAVDAGKRKESFLIK
ncbi:MAG: H-NS histone family protein [Hyphomicrobiales bacterium]|nr:MAG: H-NS histone family protein [Hyphomicrobiales bacterium]